MRWLHRSYSPPSSLFGLEVKVWETSFYYYIIQSGKSCFSSHKWIRSAAAAAYVCALYSVKSRLLRLSIYQYVKDRVVVSHIVVHTMFWEGKKPTYFLRSEIDSAHYYVVGYVHLICLHYMGL